MFPHTAPAARPGPDEPRECRVMSRAAADEHRHPAGVERLRAHDAAVHEGDLVAVGGGEAVKGVRDEGIRVGEDPRHAETSPWCA